MNRKTAERLNDLAARVERPLKLSKINASDPSESAVVGGTNDERVAVYALIEAERVRCAPAAIAAEIREAAATRRVAKTYTGGADNSLIFWGRVNDNAASAGGKCWAAVKPAIVAEIARLNADAEARYEAYRAACEQGVAVPPAAN